MTTSAGRTTPLGPQPNPMGGIHPDTAGTGRVVPPLETKAAHYSRDPNHWAVMHLMPGKETRWFASVAE